MKDAFKRVRDLLREEIFRLKYYIPTRRKLSELLKEKEPYFLNESGTKSYIDKNELMNVAKMVEEEFHELVKLPIVVLVRSDLGRGFYEVLGNVYEKEIVSKIIGRKLDDPSMINGYELQLLRSKLRTTSIISYRTDELLELI
ncbi:MAG: DUF61 family protein [Candidatus Odinarchaeota archaeon]|nr:DUF61 family protein [Candidatus Odinarchaeota archaeon]